MTPSGAPAQAPISTRPLNPSEIAYLRATVRASAANDDFSTARGIVYGVLLSSVIWSGLLVWALFFR